MVMICCRIASENKPRPPFTKYVPSEKSSVWSCFVNGIVMSNSSLGRCAIWSIKCRLYQSPTLSFIVLVFGGRVGWTGLTLVSGGRSVGLMDGMTVSTGSSHIIFLDGPDLVLFHGVLLVDLAC